MKDVLRARASAQKITAKSLRALLKYEYCIVERQIRKVGNFLAAEDPRDASVAPFTLHAGGAVYVKLRADAAPYVRKCII